MSKWAHSLNALGYTAARFDQESFAKSKYRPDKPKEGVRAWTNDPYAVQYSMGFKDRKYSLTYDLLRQVPEQLSLISAIIQTRCNQVASFSSPYRLDKSLGFEVKHKDPAHEVTPGEAEMIQSIEQFIYMCGSAEENPHKKSPQRRDDFETFLRKVVRSSLIYDQLCFEVVPTHKGDPFEFVAVDSATIRIAATDSPFALDKNYHKRKAWQATLEDPYRLLLPDHLQRGETPAYVQVIEGQIRHTFTADEMVFGIRNPRSDLKVQGYGYSEIEQLMPSITAHLNAEEYNRRFFSQGSAPKGMVNFIGDSMSPEQLENFRRLWRSSVEGVANAWRTPIMQTEQGLEWIDLQQTNSDMEYSAWLEYLTKLICGVYQIDPAEVNFDLAGGVSQTPLFESSSEWKLKASRDKGLKPLLRFIAKLINDHVVAKIDDRFSFSFVGLDELTEQEKHAQAIEMMSNYMTVNEVRRERDLPDLEFGDIPANPTFIQGMTTMQQMEQTDQQMEQGGAPEAGGAPGGAPEEGGEAEESTELAAPNYADRFTKSMDTNVLEIQFDDEDEWISLARRH